MNKRLRRKRIDACFKILGIASIFFGLFILVILIIDVFRDGAHRLRWDFFVSFPSRKPEQAGILSALVGTMWVMVTTACIAFPLGVSAGLYLEEYARKNWVTNFIEMNIANLAAVPSVIYGLLGLGLFVRLFRLGSSVLAGSLTLALLILPMIILATREALRAVPFSIREASYALGATKWQTVGSQVLPAAFGNILTGMILAMSRAVGETAPLITIGALTYIAFLPHSLLDPFTVLPIQIFNWVSRPQRGFFANAAAAIIALLFLTLLMNAAAIILRQWYQKKVRW